MPKAPDAFRTISEVAEQLETPAHVLRFWESKFTQVKPVKRAGGRRYYRPDDMALLGGIKALLHEQGMTIKGAQKVLRDQGVKSVMALARLADDDEPAATTEHPHDLSRGVTIDAIYTNHPASRDDRVAAGNILSLTVTGARRVAQPHPVPAPDQAQADPALPVSRHGNLPAIPDPRGPTASRLLGDLVDIDPHTVARRSDRIAPLVARLTRLHARMIAD